MDERTEYLENVYNGMRGAYEGITVEKEKFYELMDDADYASNVYQGLKGAYKDITISEEDFLGRVKKKEATGQDSGQPFQNPFRTTIEQSLDESNGQETKTVDNRPEPEPEKLPEVDPYLESGDVNPDYMAQGRVDRRLWEAKQTLDEKYTAEFENRYSQHPKVKAIQDSIGAEVQSWVDIRAQQLYNAGHPEEKVKEIIAREQESIWAAAQEKQMPWLEEAHKEVEKQILEEYGRDWKNYTSIEKDKQGLVEEQMSFWEKSYNSFRKGLAQGKQGRLLDVSKKDMSDEQVAELAELNKEIQSIPTTKDYLDFVEASSVGDAWKAFNRNKIEIITQLGVESMTSLFYDGITRSPEFFKQMAVGQGRGLPAPLAALYGVYKSGAGLASLNLEYSGKILETFAQAGVDTTDKDSLKKAFENEELFNKARKLALLKGVPIQIFDMVSAGVAGKLLGGGTSVVKKILSVPVEFAVQAVLGMGGEVAGELAAGEELHAGSIMAEGIGEIFGSGHEIAMGTMWHGGKKVLGGSSEANIISPLTGKPIKNKVDALMDDKISQKALDKEIELAKKGGAVINEVEDNEAMGKAIEAAGEKVERDEDGNMLYEQAAFRDPKTKEITINRSAAPKAILTHEGFHGILQQVKEQSPDTFNSILDAIENDSELSEYIESVKEHYAGWDSKKGEWATPEGRAEILEEALTHFTQQAGKDFMATKSAEYQKGVLNKIKFYLKQLYEAFSGKKIAESADVLNLTYEDMLDVKSLAKKAAKGMSEGAKVEVAAKKPIKPPKQESTVVGKLPDAKLSEELAATTPDNIVKTLEKPTKKLQYEEKRALSDWAKKRRVKLEKFLEKNPDSKFAKEEVEKSDKLLNNLFGTEKVKWSKRALNGQQNEKFFTGKAKESSSKVPYKPVLKIEQESPTAKAYQTYSAGGNFTNHISKMIAGFQEKQILVADAIVKGKQFKSFLDLGTSEGGMIKTVGSQRPDMRTVGVDPNSQMRKNYESTPKVANAEFKQEAFQGSWIEDDGTPINEFGNEEKFDVINEDFTFQFVNNDRKRQVAGVKDLLTPEGVFITSEKFITHNKIENEAKKAEHQSKYFTPNERTKDKEEIIVGMEDDMVGDVEYFDILKDNFKYVTEFWNAGEFKGYIASDSKANLQEFKANVGDLTTEFTDHTSLTKESVVNAAEAEKSAIDKKESQVVENDSGEKVIAVTDPNDKIKHSKAKNVIPENVQEKLFHKDGQAELFHYSYTHKGEFDEVTTGNKANLFSKSEYMAWGRPRAFFYTRPSQRESALGGADEMYSVHVPLNKIYPLDEDPMGLFKQGREIANPRGVKQSDYGVRIYQEGVFDEVKIKKAFESINNELADAGIDVRVEPKISQISESSDRKILNSETIGEADKKHSSKIEEISKKHLPHASIQIDEASYRGLRDAEPISPTTDRNKFEATARLADEAGYKGFMYDHMGNGKIVVMWENTKVISEEESFFDEVKGNVKHSKKLTVKDIAGKLESDTQKKIGSLPFNEGLDVERAERALALGRDDIMYGLAHMEEHGLDWYVEDVVEADGLLKQAFPELQDPANMTIFKAVMAPTSTGTNPEINTVTAAKVWDVFQEGGRKALPLTQKGAESVVLKGKDKTYELVRKGKTSIRVKDGKKVFSVPVNKVKQIKPRQWIMKSGAIHSGFGKLNQLISDVGIKKASEWLLSKHSISELRKYQAKLPDLEGNVSLVNYNRNDQRYGAYILGEKIGSYMLNLSGIHDQLTVDLWAMRTWNRWMGQMFNDKGDIVQSPRVAKSKDSERVEMRNIFSKLANEFKLSVAELQALLWVHEQDLYRSYGYEQTAKTYKGGAARVLEGRGDKPVQNESDSRTAEERRKAALAEGLAQGNRVPEKREPIAQSKRKIRNAKLTQTSLNILNGIANSPRNKALQNIINKNPDKFEKSPQVIENIQSELGKLTDEDLLALNQDSDKMFGDPKNNVGMLAKIEAMNRATDLMAKDKEAGLAQLESVYKNYNMQLSMVGQLLRQGGEFNKSNPIGIVMLINKLLNEKGYALTRAEKEGAKTGQFEELIDLTGAYYAASHESVGLIKKINEGKGTKQDYKDLKRANKQADKKYIELISYTTKLIPKGAEILGLLMAANALTTKSLVMNVMANTVYNTTAMPVENFMGDVVNMIHKAITEGKFVFPFPVAFAEGTAAHIMGWGTGLQTAVRGVDPNLVNKVETGQTINGLRTWVDLAAAAIGRKRGIGAWARKAQTKIDETGQEVLIPFASPNAKPSNMAISQKAAEATLGLVGDLMYRGLALGDAAPRKTAERAEAVRIYLDKYGFKGLIKGRSAFARWLLTATAEEKAKIKEAGDRAVFTDDKFLSNLVLKQIQTLGRSIDEGADKKLGAAAPTVKAITHTLGKANALYVKVPVNLAQLMVEWANPAIPLAAFVKNAKVNPRRAGRNLGRAMMGISGYALGTWLIGMGALSVIDTDDDDVERAFKYTAGGRSGLNIDMVYRAIMAQYYGMDEDFIKNPEKGEKDEAINLATLGVTGLQLHFIAKLHEYMAEDGIPWNINSMHNPNMLIHGVRATGASFTEQTFMQGMGAMRKGLFEGDMNYLGSLSETLSNIVVPNNLVALRKSNQKYKINKADKDAWKAIQSRMIERSNAVKDILNLPPIKDKNITPYIDLFGNFVLQTPEGFEPKFWNLLDARSPVNIEETVYQEVWRLMKKYDGHAEVSSEVKGCLTMPSDHVTIKNALPTPEEPDNPEANEDMPVQLHEKDYINMMQLTGTYKKFKLEELIQSDKYLDGSDLDKYELVGKVNSKVNATFKKWFTKAINLRNEIGVIDIDSEKGKYSYTNDMDWEQINKMNIEDYYPAASTVVTDELPDIQPMEEFFKEIYK